MSLQMLIKNQLQRNETYTNETYKRKQNKPHKAQNINAIFKSKMSQS